MKGTAQAETEILTQVLALRNDPLGFVYWAYPWGVPNTPFENLKGPREWQIEELRRIGEYVSGAAFKVENDIPVDIWRSVYSSGRGPGKSALFGMLAHWHISCHWGAPTAVFANNEVQLRTTTFPEFGRWIGTAVNSHWFHVEGMKITVQPWLADLARKDPIEGGLKIDPEYWYIQGRTWNPDNPAGIAGLHSPYGMLVVIDEATGVPSGVWDAIEGFFVEDSPYRIFVAGSQMRNRSGRFFEIFNDSKMGAGWRARTISTRGMPGVNQAVVESQIVRYGIDSDFVLTEIMGLPPRTSEDQFIPFDCVRAAQQNELGQDYGEPLILGIDPAPRGKTSWAFRQGRNARDCVGNATHGHWQSKDNVQIAQAVLDLDAKFHPDAICIDFGMGTGVIDILKRKPWIVRKLHEVRFGDSAHDGKDSEYATHAIELWARVRDWLPGGMIVKDEGEKGTLSQQLTDRGWRWSGREEGKKILETKEDLQKRGVKSPDDADALACTFEVNPPRVDSRRMRPGADVRVAEGVGKSAFFD